MYANELVSIKNADNIISWEDETIKHLEGSERMFNIRRNRNKLDNKAKFDNKNLDFMLFI